MLLLTRKELEEIVINGNIVVTVMEIRPNMVRIGVQAPDGIRVDRREVHERRKRLEQEGSGSC